ncbi:tryptophan synthase subunit alpha [Neisseriaceae bacterium CLB008]|nr:tryptophan synthase subunit alpha [Neisseriaceae bacterium]
MSRIKTTFARLAGEKAMIPFITAGDPHLDVTLAMMHSMADNGADIIELGVPFSDPMADGPTIQRATERALQHHVSLTDVMALVAKFRQTNAETPVVLMGYLNPIMALGFTEFATAAAAAGVDGVLTVDCPAEVIDTLHAALAAAGLDCIFLVAPTTPQSRLAVIAQKASGFVYYVSLKGVTGSASLDIAEVQRKIECLRQDINLPIGVGFGIKDRQSAQQLATVADAIIVGSRFIEEIEANPNNEPEAVGALVKTFKTAITG